MKAAIRSAPSLLQHPRRDNVPTLLREWCMMTPDRTICGEREAMKTAYQADAARFEKAFRAADAIRTTDDGFAYIDETKVPAALVRSYQRFMQYGAANGLA